MGVLVGCNGLTTGTPGPAGCCRNCIKSRRMVTCRARARETPAGRGSAGNGDGVRDACSAAMSLADARRVVAAHSRQVRSHAAGMARVVFIDLRSEEHTSELQ